jgi:hypothetical protein
LPPALLPGGCYHTAQKVSDALDAAPSRAAPTAAAPPSTTLPATSIVPNASLKLTPNFSITLENMLIGAAIYYFVDPLSPNWEGEMRRVSEDTFSIAMRSKRFRSTGGDGEAGRVFKRNAEQIVREGGFAGYAILAYSEGIESEVIGAYRYAEGTIRINRK